MNSALMEQARIDYRNHVINLIKTEPSYRRFLIAVYGEQQAFELFTFINKLNAEVKK